ncbi:MAG: SDR family NAD(P)-dependent oxidoreductase [Legionella longbeachae]|nr:SDR family NAD(P)-dependent oxidoreductase [Legionella longbeachae]
MKEKIILITGCSSGIGLDAVFALKKRGHRVIASCNASKHALEGISDTLRLELRASGIDVITIEPGPIESRFRDNCVDDSMTSLDIKNSHFSKQYEKMLSTYKQNKKDSIFTKKPDAVIKKFIHAIESKKPHLKYPVTFPAYLMIFLKKVLSPKMLDRFFLFISKRELS